MVPKKIVLSRKQIREMQSCDPQRKYQALGKDCITLAKEYYNAKDGNINILGTAYFLAHPESNEYCRIDSTEILRDLTQKFID